MAREPVKKRPAAERTPWPPSDFFTFVDCDLSQNWWTLAPIAGRTDPWDVIVYNFNTRDPDVVNWYLFHKLGCNVTTPDGLNYRFGAYKPGTKVPDLTRKFRIYLPFHDWKPETSADEAARNMVVATLTSPAAVKTHFSLGGFTLYPGDLTRVASLVDKKRINVRVDPSFGDVAFYQPAAAISTKGMSAGDTMYLSFDRPISLGHLALLVHEAVHAAFDARPVRHIGTPEAEGMAYVAQALYGRHRGSKSAPNEVHGDALAQKILDMAWDIADAVARGSPPARADLKDFHTAIDLHPWYSGKGQPRYRGVR